MYDFQYIRPLELGAATSELKAPDARPLAGGQSLIPVLKQRLASPSHLVDLAALGLAGIRESGDTISIGAMTLHCETANDPVVRRRISGLARLAGMIGDRQVRARGTMGGALANNDPAACYPSAVLALDAVIVTHRRHIQSDDFFRGLYTTALEDDEIITAIEFPVPVASTYLKFRHPASRFAMVGVFVAQRSSGDVRVAVTGASQTGVFRHAAAEAALSAEFSLRALSDCGLPRDDLVDDLHGSSAYRAHLVDLLTRRAVMELSLARDRHPDAVT